MLINEIRRNGRTPKKPKKSDCVHHKYHSQASVLKLGARVEA